MSTVPPQRVAIIGGGISGMVAALRLSELTAGSKNVEIQLFESAPRLGGLVASERIGDYLIERGADSFITNKPGGVALCRKLGLESDLIGTDDKNRRSLILSKGRPIVTPDGLNLIAPGSAWSILRTPILSWRGKLRCLLEPLVPRREEEGDESLASFTRRRLGQEMLDRIVQPMVGGIYTADPEKLSLMATLPRFLEMERRHGSLFEAMHAEDASGAEKAASGARYGLFASLRRGMWQMMDALEDRVRAVARVEVGAVVSEVTLNHWRSKATAGGTRGRGGGEEKKGEGGEMAWTDACGEERRTAFSAVILATPAHQMSRVLLSALPAVAAELAQIEYASSAIVVTGHDTRQIDHPLDAFGLVIPAIEKRKILSVSFLNRKFPDRAPPDKVILRTFMGGALQPEMMDLSDGQMIETTLAELRSIFGVRSEPEFAVVARYPRAMPQYHVGHMERVAKIGELLAPTPWIALAGNTLGGVGLPDAILSGEKAAERIGAAIGMDL
jgi:protoporphyrinogen/coproporphyrinogen III oxidase